MQTDHRLIVADILDGLGHPDRGDLVRTSVAWDAAPDLDELAELACLRELKTAVEMVAERKIVDGKREAPSAKMARIREALEALQD